MSARLVILCGLFGCLGLPWVESGMARAQEIPHSVLPYSERSGPHDGEAVGKRVAWSTQVDVGDAPWVRIFFDSVHLDHHSHVELHGVGEGQWQSLDARAMEEWNRSSAVFRGGRVRIELHVDASDRAVEIGIRQLLVGERAAYKAVCGNDDRVASTDNRVARINPVGCTAWAIGNGAYLTAGHCADFDPDGAGPMLPDLILDLSGVLEFNVPASNPDGTTNPSLPIDQYPINLTNVVWRFDGQSQGLGKDWAIFGVNPNSTTGLLPHQAYGVQPFRITRELPNINDTIRLTGFGGDTGTANFTNQTGVGPFDGEFNSGPDVWILHRADSEGGNSGGPLIWEDLGIAIGVHTNGGCDQVNGNNAACSFEFDPLEIAINNFYGVGSQHVDPFHPLRVSAEGSLYRPWAQLADGIAQVPAQGNVIIYPGIVGIPAGTTITAPCNLLAGGGEVIIVGN